MQRKTVFALTTAVALGALLVSACSGDDSGDEDGLPGDVDATNTPAQGGEGTPPGPELLEQPEPAQEIAGEVTAPGDGVVELVTRDTAFVDNNVEMPLGEPVVIRVTNEDSVTHNLRIAGLDGKFNTEDDAVTDPQSIRGGESGELTFAPPVAGAYTFQCDFHPASMGGQVVVR